jgi:osomolarity two-component system response regulator SSK1
MMIQTMLQISPPQVLDAAKEQFSACSLSIPTSSMSAMFTTVKNLNYISANMTSFCAEPSDVSPLDDMGVMGPLETSSHNDFDIGEMLQSVGDALSGAAAQAGVDVVLFHGDTGMKHISVRGDENGISYTLSHVGVLMVFVRAYLTF